MKKWSVKEEGATKAYRTVSSKDTALRIAKKIVGKHDGARIIAINKDGTYKEVNLRNAI